MTTRVVDVPVLTDFVKAYDVRGLVPEQLSPDVARAIVMVLQQPEGFELREVVAAPSTEPSWP